MMGINHAALHLPSICSGSIPADSQCTAMSFSSSSLLAHDIAISISMKRPRSSVGVNSRVYTVHTPTAQTKSSLYDVLGISFGASKDEIKASYRRLARLCHPDTVADPLLKEKCTKDFIDIHTAYTTLSNPHRKAGYDRHLLSKSLQCKGRRVDSPNSYNVNAEALVFNNKYPSFADSLDYKWRGRNWETDQCW
eukprot:Gb_36084 [translate_table: standard]